MSIEKDLFDQALKEVEYYNDFGCKEYDIDELFDKFINIREQQGYKLVHIDLIKRCISHIGIASCHPANSLEDDQKMDADIDALEKAMIGAIE